MPLDKLGDLLGLSFPGCAVRGAGLRDLWSCPSGVRRKEWMGAAQSPGSPGGSPEDSRAPLRR